MRRTYALLSLCLLASCWPGWDFICDPTPSREHRVEDLRVLAIVVDQPSVLIPPGLLFDDAPPADPLLVRISPRVFDPRGGGPIEVAINTCVSSAFGQRAGAPCPAGARALASFSAYADAEEPLGGVPGLDVTVALDDLLVRALYAEAGMPNGSLGVLFFQLVVSVSRSVDGKVERESATVPWFFQLDALSPDMPTARLFALLEAEGGMLCTTGASDACAPAEEAVCGNGIVESPETCDPPGTEGCDGECYAMDPCDAQRGGAVCLIPPVLPPVPALSGLSFSEAGAGFLVNAAPDIEPSDFIEVPSGGRLYLTPVVSIEDAVPTLQWVVPPQPQCAPDSPGASAHLQCDAGFPANVSFRFYLGDGAAELVAPADPVNGFYGNTSGGYEAAAVAFVEGTEAGTEEPLVVVIASDRGAMSTAVFTLVAR